MTMTVTMFCKKLYYFKCDSCNVTTGDFDV